MEVLKITVGLPGSGKTYWSMNEKRKDSKNIKYINIDYYMFEDYNYKKIKDEQKRFIKIIKSEVYFGKYNINILDGLFLNTDDIIKILTNLSCLPDDLVEIHYWNENKENCLWNDQYRRNINSTISIENMQLEKIDIKKIKDALIKHNDEIEKDYGWRETCYDFDIKIVEHEIERKSDLQIFIDKYNINVNENNQLNSESWKTGGEWWSYTGARGGIEAESPVEFKELDELFEKVCPNITYLQYKKIFSECINTYEDTVNDYYSRDEIAWYVCDIERLYEMLLEMNLIE